MHTLENKSDLNANNNG